MTRLWRQLPEVFDTVHWHGDTFDPAPGKALFRGEPYPAQGFRLGPSVGLQFHAELGPAEFRAWVEGSAAASGEAAATRRPLLASGLPRLEAAVPALDRLLAGVAGDMRRAVGG